MHSLVTGGAGFIGSHIVEALVEKGHEVTILDNLASGKAGNLRGFKSKVKLVNGSITDRDTLAKVMDGVDYVFHEAAQTSVQESIRDPKGTWETNITGTKLLLNAAVTAKVKRVMFASSASIYGNMKPPLKESGKVRPISTYGNTKRIGEMLMREYYEKEKLETVSLRYFNVYGPRQDPASPYSGAVGKFAKVLMEDGQPVIYGNGWQQRDFIYITDVAEANMLAMKAKKAKGEVFNVATGRGVKILDLLRMMKKIMGSKAEAKFAPQKKGDILYSFGDTEKAKKLLGFEAKMPLEKGLEETIKWIRKG